MEKLSTNHAQLFLCNKYTVFTMGGTVCLTQQKIFFLESYSSTATQDIKYQNFENKMSTLKNFHLHYYWTNFNQIWHKAFFDEEDSNLFKWRATPFIRGDIIKIAKLHLKTFKNLLLQNHWANFNQVHEWKVTYFSLAVSSNS